MFDLACVCVCVFPWEVMQCSAAMDVLFVMDGSYSVGKGSFERAKHYAIKLCQVLDVGPDKVPVFSRLLCLSPSSLLVIIIFFKNATLLLSHPGESRLDSVRFHSSLGVRPGLARHQTGTTEAHEEGFLQVGSSSYSQTKCLFSRINL